MNEHEDDSRGPRHTSNHELADGLVVEKKVNLVDEEVDRERNEGHRPHHRDGVGEEHQRHRQRADAGKEQGD